MGGVRGFTPRISARQKLAVTILFLCAGTVGCGEVCGVISSNPPTGTGTISNTNTCVLNPMNGTVRLRISAPAATAQSGGLPQVQHIFVTIRGIEATANAFADANSPDWRELTPNLATQPAQVDLLTASGEPCAGISFESAAVPADTYRQIRLSLAQIQPDASDSAPPGNSCGMAGPNCIKTSDGAIRPLVFDSTNSKFSQLQISSDHIRGGFFQILPDTTANLGIEFNSQSSLFVPAGESVRMVPIFTVDPQTACESAASMRR
jgi:Domain of unknown function (DUF4382)